jgi:hypothetical protein
MKNLLQSQSIAWARGVCVALETEGIPCKLLGEFDRGVGLMPWLPVRVAILNDEDLERAQAIVARLQPRTPPPPSWRWQKRGLLLLGLDLLLFGALAARLDAYRNDREGSVLVLYALAAVVLLVFITGVLFVVLGPRADKAAKGTP